MPQEIEHLCERLGMERPTLRTGDEIIGFCWNTSMGYFITHGVVISIDGDKARVRVLKDYYLSGGSFPRDEEINVSVDYLKKSISDRVREDIEFLDWFAGQFSKD